MNTETTEERINQIAMDHPFRNYEITWANGRREKLQATQVNMPRESLIGSSNHMVEFRGPLGREDGMGRCGRLLLAARLGPDIVRIRDLDTDIAEVWTAEVKVVKPPRWSRFLNGLTFGSTRRGK